MSMTRLLRPTSSISFLRGLTRGTTYQEKGVFHTLHKRVGSRTTLSRRISCSALLMMRIDTRKVRFLKHSSRLVTDIPESSTNVRWRRTLSYLKQETKRKWARKV